MQLKGLVRFFTVLLVIYSLYELSFTWVVRSHEKKMEAKAKQFADIVYKDSASNVYDRAYKDRLKRLLDSTEDVTVHYGPTGAISYRQAKENELNLGLDLQGGINVTLEVELGDLLRSMSNGSKDPLFLQALANADNRKKNSDADFITLFAEEYKRLAPDAKLAALFATPGNERIKITDSDDKVLSELRREGRAAFDRTYRVILNRIDQFGVAQPNINPNPEQGIITVELPGIQDQERVRKYLQSSANLQFWEVYNITEIAEAIGKADESFNILMGGKSKDTVAAKKDTAGKNTTDTTIGDIADIGKTDTAGGLRKSLQEYIQFNSDPSRFGDAVIGFVQLKDTNIVRTYLENPAIRKEFPSDIVFAFGIPDFVENKKNKFVSLYALKTLGRDKAKVEGDMVQDAGNDFNVQGDAEVTMKMSPAGTRAWAKMTTENVGRSIAIVLDNMVYSAPRVNEPITGGNSSISGVTPEEAKDLASILKAGKLPARPKIVQEQVVGPTLGRDAIRGGATAFLISFVVIFLLMLVYYNTSGWVANIALILNLLFTIGVLTGLGATLTAPGIAGLVLTIGMAVDTNVLIYERIKEELTRGKSYALAISDGYRRSLPPVLDGHITTLLTAIILFSFGLGPVKGFATTQIIGILLSLFCGILVSRWVTEWFTSKKKHLEYFTPLSKKVFQKAKYKFIEYRKVAYMISLVVLALGIGAFFNGFDYGVEFKGGRSYVVRFNNVPDVEKVRADLTAALGASPVIKTIGANNQLDITTAFEIENTSREAGAIVEAKLLEGLRNHLPAGVNQEQFTKNHIMGSTTVLPTISDELVNGAKWATFWSLLLMSLYIFIRFRDWRYSLGTIAALLHDVLVVLIIFSFMRAIVPFPMEIDQHFIAAVLTVIGFSVNDTVVIFDRIREYSRNMAGQPKATIINAAINDTLSRTIMTSLTVFITILILFIFGGEVTRGFAFAMLIGVIVGAYSSVFVAAPILVDLGGEKVLGEDLTPERKRSVKTKAVTANKA